MVQGVATARGRSSRRTVIMIAAALCLGGRAAAQQQPAQPPQTITLEQAVQIALERNPTLQVAENAAELNSLTVRQQRMQLLPNLNLNTTTDQTYGRAFNQDEGRIINQTTNGFSSGVNSNVVLFNGFSNLANVRQARLNETAGQQDVVRAEQTVVFTVLSNYLNVIEQAEQVRVQQENLAAQQAQETQIRAYVEAGVRPISDLYQQQATTASVRLALVQTRRAQELARMALIRTLQLDPRREYDFQVPELGPLAATTRDSVDLDRLTDEALARRPDLAAAESRLQAAQQQVRIASGTRWPALSLSVGYNTRYTSSSDLEFLDQLNERRGGSVGLGLSLPVFDRAASSINKQRGRIQVENARIALENVRQNVAIEVRTAYLDLEYSQEQALEAEAQLRSAQLALEASQERYNIGAATLVELSQARAAQVRAASDLVNARYGLVFQSRLIDYYLGAATLPGS